MLALYANLAFIMKSSLIQSVSDLIRVHVAESYLKPAIRTGESTFAVNVGNVHRALKLTNRVPQVCSALESRKLLEENHLRILSKTGPPSGQSTTVTFTYEILPREPKDLGLTNPLSLVRGLARDVFKQLGGGEAFIRNERGAFTDRSEK
jgi:hypothetical protein